jgi:hypothetical protein
MKVDNETKQELTAGENIRLMTESEGWQIVKAQLDAKILDLQMIGNVEGTTAEEKVRNMEVRAGVVAMLYTWLKNDVYGRVEQASNTQDALTDKGTDEYVDRG